MKKSTLLAGLVLASVAANAAEISKLVVRQNWPWTPDVRVDFTLTGVSEATDVAVKCYRGSTELAVPDPAVSGRRYALTESGNYTLSIDARKIAELTAAKFMDDFRVELTASASAESTGEVLYRIYDLQHMTTQDVTRGALLNGEFGAFETDFGVFKMPNGTPFSTSLKDVAIWTGVTNDVKYATTHLVMRRIPATGEEWTMCPTTDGSASAKGLAHQVKFTKTYWISVFELTQEQYYWSRGKWPIDLDSNRKTVTYFTNETYRSCRPVELACWEYNIRGWNLWPNDDPETAYRVADGRIPHDLRKKFPDARFDLCTEAQWEYACRAGTATRYYCGSDVQNQDVACMLGRYCQNGGMKDGADEPWDQNVELPYGTAKVGSYAPNAFGLYDMLGNAWEICLDYTTKSAADFDNTTVAVNPPGPLTGDNSKRCVRGGAYNNTYLNGTCGMRNSGSYLTYGYGMRLCITED